MVITTVHPTDKGDEIFANCTKCGVYEPVGPLLTDPDWIIEWATDDWTESHVCEGTQPSGFAAAEFPV
jgi:hypothetical protein